MQKKEVPKLRIEHLLIPTQGNITIHSLILIKFAWVPAWVQLSERLSRFSLIPVYAVGPKIRMYTNASRIIVNNKTRRVPQALTLTYES